MHPLSGGFVRIIEPEQLRQLSGGQPDRTGLDLADLGAVPAQRGDRFFSADLGRFPEGSQLAAEHDALDHRSRILLGHVDSLPLPPFPRHAVPPIDRITLVGILVADPELRISPTGVAVASFTVVANDGRYDPDTGKWVDQGVTFLRCSIRSHAAENVAESLTKGTRVLVIGMLRQRAGEATDSDKRYAYEVDATEVGVSLKRATVKITRAPRCTTGESGSAGRWDAGP